MSQTPRDPADVRMRGFARRTSVVDALDWIDARVEPLPSESLPLGQLAGRVLAEAIVSEVDVPGFPRAMMDGFAVQAADTQGASAYNPLPLSLVGGILPGQSSDLQVERGSCLRIMTGAAMPPGADAVLPAEFARIHEDVSVREGSLQSATADSPLSVLAAGEVSPGKHVGQPGEDVQRGQVVAKPGRRLRPQDLGLLASIGAAKADVVRRPQVRVIVTGDELLPAGAAPDGVRVVDANSSVLKACILRDGGEPVGNGLTADDPQAILSAMRETPADLILVSGGSSVGEEDYAPGLLAEHGELAIHGIAIRPSSPAGMGIFEGRLVFLLPGNPVSCLCAYDMFAGRAIRQLAGRSKQLPYRKWRGRLTRKIVSQIGRVDYARVKLSVDNSTETLSRSGMASNSVEPIAISGASVLSSTTRADGFVLVPADSEGFPDGAEVDVWLYDNQAVEDALEL